MHVRRLTLLVMALPVALMGQAVPSPSGSIRQVGDIRYTGPHTWNGVIQVTTDDATYQDGTISAAAGGIPQGVTFSGNRKNITLKNLTFNGVGDGINISNNQNVDGLTIDNCKFLDCRTPDLASSDVLAGHRGIGIFGSRGKNWTIKNTTFKTKTCDRAAPDQRDGSAQYACRLAEVVGLNVSQSRFENRNGKACMWLMFVRAAAFNHVEFDGGPIRIGMRPDDLPGNEKGGCRNIIFRDCTFNFGVFDEWPASILIFPGCENILFENCRFNTVPDCGWWIDIDERHTRDIRWKNCTWNGEPIVAYKGVRSSMNIERMRANNIAPVE